MDMEQIRAAADDYYKGSTEEKKRAARRFFRAMDADNNGKISIDEFMAFLKDPGLRRVKFYSLFEKLDSEKFYWLFEKLDKDNNGTLDFEELFTLFYILSHDEYRDQLNSWANTKVRRSRRKKEDAGQKWRSNWQEVLQSFQCLLDAYDSVLQTMAQGGCECSIM